MKAGIILACVAMATLALSCGQSYRTGIEGDLVGTRPASTSLSLPSSVKAIVLSGSVTLSAGTAKVTLLPPSGTEKTWTFIHSGMGTDEVFEAGPFTAAASAGEYRLRVEGLDEVTAGMYSLALEGR
jgi:hypothetical protein